MHIRKSGIFAHMKHLSAIILLFISATAAWAQTDTTEVDKEAAVHEVTVTSHSGLRRLGGATNGVSIGKQELFKAACCNLGESFTTNPSVDVSYSDAATGAKQIRLLGLSGTYVQMLTEQMPNFKGTALPYSLDFVPGPWMHSIEVSKGASTVKNGYESMTGQIDIEYRKPNDAEQLNANLYADSKSRLEANVDGNLHLNERLSTVLLAHAEENYGHHDDNDDGFLDQPRRKQGNLQSRWKYVSDSWIFHAGLGALKEKRESGQTAHGYAMQHPYKIETQTDRYEAYMKNAFILNAEHQTNLALMTNGAIHLLDAQYGHSKYNAHEKTANAQLMLETNFTDEHQLSAGVTLNHHFSKEDIHEYKTNADHTAPLFESLNRVDQQETTSGLYAQYTFNHHNRLTVMAGLRADHSNLFDWFVTPRLHVKYMPTDLLTLRVSAGKGYRTARFMAENHFLLACSAVLTDGLSLAPYHEASWNYGVSAALNLPLGGKTLKLNAEYYYTRFQHQLLYDHELHKVYPLSGKSYSHTYQIDASYQLVDGLDLTAAWRWNDVKSTYHGLLLERPLTSRYKGLLSASYAPGMAIWHFDATLQLNGGGRIVGTERFGAFEQLQAQVTRDFRHVSVYVGGENLTNRQQKTPIRGAADPWGTDFDATLVWGPVHGPTFYAGLRFNLEKY